MEITDADDQLLELRDKLQQAEARAEAIHHVIQTVARSTFDLDSVLQTVIDHAVLLCHADTGNIARRVGEVYRMAAFTSFGAEYERMVREHVYEPGRDSVVGRTALERDVVHIVDVLEDPDYAMSNLQSAGGYRSVLGVPMLKDGEPIGVIAVGRNEVRAFSDDEIRLLKTFADQIVVVIENVRLFQMVERQRSSWPASRRTWPDCSAATRASSCWPATAARSPACSAISEGSPRSPRPPNRKTSWTCSAPTSAWSARS